ncbi:EF-hand calcium-binding domain-containing protein 11 [Motacilla alba alba]|uniref:EF-hand calcium-binding domain-containing protein 11 n=1 Tax=Motacilla alba alba TaxID=1094192 RepID=UPI0018D569E8|nr:EF-hand calcium-binding domain-containing protein 11 [Motacilla alba alba]
MKTVFELCNEDSKGYLSREDSTVGLRDRGFLPFEDFKRAFNSVSSKLSEKVIFEATREVDQDSDGYISFKEFESAMKYGQDEVSPVYFA